MSLLGAKGTSGFFKRSYCPGDLGLAGPFQRQEEIWRVVARKAARWIFPAKCRGLSPASSQAGKKHGSAFYDASLENLALVQDNRRFLTHL